MLAGVKESVKWDQVFISTRENKQISTAPIVHQYNISIIPWRKYIKDKQRHSFLTISNKILQRLGLFPAYLSEIDTVNDCC